MRLTVAIPTFNPHPGRLARTVEGLQAQTLRREEWEFLLIDNASHPDKAPKPDSVAWHPVGRIVEEKSPGLTSARRCATREAKGDVIIFVDDDNVLSPNYLEDALSIMEREAKLGAIGGKITGEFEEEPPSYIESFYNILAIRDKGPEPQVAHSSPDLKTFPSIAPVGAGMVIRKQILQAYFQQCESEEWKLSLDRIGNALSSGGDNDIAISVLKQGYDLGYFPQLSMLHLIPKGRTEKDYLARLAEASAVNFVQVLAANGMCPWSPIPTWTLSLRCAKAWLRTKPWTSPEAYIRWRGACGLLRGRTLIRKFQ